MPCRRKKRKETVSWGLVDSAAGAWLSYEDRQKQNPCGWHSVAVTLISRDAHFLDSQPN